MGDAVEFGVEHLAGFRAEPLVGRGETPTKAQHFLPGREGIAVTIPSVCRLSATFVHSTQPVEIFGNLLRHFVAQPSADLLVRLILRRSSQGNPSVGG